MGHQAESFHEQITVIDFIAYRKQATEYFFDATPDQCSKHIWDKICPTALIIYINVYKIEQHQAIFGFKKKLTENELARINKNF